MRGMFLVVLLLLMPISNATQIPPSDIDNAHDNQWFEAVITSGSGQWNPSLWDNIVDSGGFPLRLLSETELLAWWNSDLELDDNLTISVAGEGDWRYTLDLIDYEPKAIKILFEPRLPSFAFEQIYRDMALIGTFADDLIGVDYSVMPHKITIPVTSKSDIAAIIAVPGVLWVEPVLPTESRNLVASAYMGDGYANTQPHWDYGLNGEGIVLGVADSGIDADHSCFRETADTVGNFGAEHRKIIVLNNSIDGGDDPGESDYRHGTHVAGSLVCHDVYSLLNGEQPRNASTMAYKAKLVFQDIVSEDGWVPPDNVTELLLENAINGGIIHSNSWGDDTTAYTDRTADFDLWAIEVPWSLSFIAPGNTGGQLLEPANGRNVVAIGATNKGVHPELWSSSSVGPTEQGTYGIFAVAPGVSINSAKADGFANSMNNAMRVSSGTSMATPLAASFTGIIQQMIQQGWILGANEDVNSVNLSDLVPTWSNVTNKSVELGEGFTPSGPLLRSVLAIATQDLMSDGEPHARNNQSGWGVLSLAELIDFDRLAALGENNSIPVTPNVWIHDSYRSSFDIDEWLTERLAIGGLGELVENPWNGAGAVGPFLQTGDTWTKRLVPNQQEDFEVVMSFPAKPEPFLVDSLELTVRLSNGNFAVGEVYNHSGYSSIFPAENFTDLTINQSNETSLGVKIPITELGNVDWLDIDITANYVAPGNSHGTVGVDGNRVGFALAAKGVIRDSTNWEDSDGDGLPNAVDLCPNQNSQPYDGDDDGCPDDVDSDGIADEFDLCPGINASGFDNNLDGCIDDSDGDGIGDDVDVCITEILDNSYPVDEHGCRPVDSKISIDEISLEGLDSDVWSEFIRVRWEIKDDDFDPYLTGARIMLNQTGNYSFFPILTCTAHEVRTDNNTHYCTWNIPEDLPIFDIVGYALHVQYFAQSLNASPEANNDLVYLDSETYFTAEISHEPATNRLDSDAGASSATRALGWGLLTIFAVAIMLQRLWLVMKENQSSVDNGRFSAGEPFKSVETEGLRDNCHNLGELVAESPEGEP